MEPDDTIPMQRAPDTEPAPPPSSMTERSLIPAAAVYDWSGFASEDLDDDEPEGRRP